MARNVYQYEQPRCPDNWNEAERRFYNRLIETLDDIYSKYGRLDANMLAKSVIERIDNSAATAMDKMVADIVIAGKIAADSIEATFANLVSLSAKYGNFDFETVKNLVSDAMVLEKGQADYIHITNLAATYAQAVNATIGNLVIRSSDGQYYQLDVNSDGKVSAERVEVSDGEIAAGETESGKVIVGTHIVAETLGTETLAATQALINKLDAARINVDTLIAREEFVQELTASEAFINSLVANSAFINLLRTTKIVGDTTITMMVNQLRATQIEAGETARVFRQETFPGSAEKVKPRDLLVIPSTGQVYQAVDMSRLNLRFYLEDNGDLTYTIEDFTGHYTLEVRGYDLYAENFVVPIRDDGTIGQPYAWELVRDLELQSEINAQAEAMAQAVVGLNKDIESLQDQLDGNITTWFEDYVPTATNLPASEWVTEADKNMHIGDLFYVDNEALEEDGYCYRWQLVDGVYGWVLLRDSAVTKALEEAKEAKDLADNKRRIFVATPAPPYDVGDMWVQGSSGDILRCNAAKAKGQAYAASDWILASKYTDDTKANQAIDMVNGTVASVDVEYALSASSTTPPEASAWSTVAPEWVNGKFMWSRTTTTLINGQVYSSNITCIAGAVGPQGKPGADGTDGAGIVSVSEQYYLSPSKVQPTGGAWLDYVPVWAAGMYMWTRTKVVYTNGNITYTDPYCDTVWELAEDLSVYEGTLPPSTTPAAGKLWLDLSTTPPIFRRWKGEDYDTSDMDGWEIVNDTTAIEESFDKVVTKEEFQHVIRVETDGLHVGAEDSNNELHIDHDSLDVNIGGKTFTSLGANYVEFGNYQIRRTADGGLAFKMR